MSDDLKEDVKKRIDANFGLENLTMFAPAITQLENAVQTATANALKELIQDNAARVLNKKLNRNSKG